MAGLKLVLPVSFPSTVPMLRDDPILSSGSLLLLDFAHPGRPMAAGVPASGSAVPNIALAEARALVGATADVDAQLVYGAGFSGTKGKLERTAKGGFHGIASQSVDLASGDGVAFSLAASIKAYLVANPTHRYYLSVWDRVTRAAATSSTIMEAGVIGANNTQFLGAVTNSAVSQPTAVVPPANQRVAPGFNGVGNRFASLGTSVDINLNAGIPYIGGHMFGAPANSYNAAVLGVRNKLWPSLAAYRFYVEDLTVSGRSYATVDALDFAEYTKQVLTAGGRYAGDTLPTAPSAVP